MKSGTSGAGTEAAGKKRRIRLPKLSLEEDIRYRGPLSYLHFQIFGWICIVLAFVIVLMNLGSKANADLAPRLAGWINVLGYVTDLSLPFLLIANFSMILNSTEGYRKQLVKNGGAMLAITLLFLLLFNRYILGAFRLISSAPEETADAVSAMIRSGTQYGFLAFNIFVDLFLCTTFMFFLNYQPKRFFTGKARYIFRLFTLLPVACEAASIWAKGMAALGKLTIPVECYPLLTVKPPMTFVLFMVMAFFIKTREIRFRRHGRTHEEYQLFLQTKRNSLHFSVFAAVAMLAAGALDLLIVAVTPRILGGGDLEKAFWMLGAVFAVGFGNSIVLAFLSPGMLLFSYTRKPGNRMASSLVPAAGLALILLVFIQGIYQILQVLNLPKVSLTQLSDTVQQIFEEIRK